jgi:hypothetical protein
MQTLKKLENNLEHNFRKKTANCTSLTASDLSHL